MSVGVASVWYFLHFSVLLSVVVTLLRPAGNRRVQWQATLIVLRFTCLVTVSVEKFTLTSRSIRSRCTLRTWTCPMFDVPYLCLTLRVRKRPAMVNRCLLGVMLLCTLTKLVTLLCRKVGTMTACMDPGAPGLAMALMLPRSRHDPPTCSCESLSTKLDGASVRSLL